jgi:transglutaminase-like putative cysteine protease
VSPPGADFIFNVQAAQTRQQRVIEEHLTISQPAGLNMHMDAVSRTRHVRLTAGPGLLALHSEAVVEVTHHLADPDTLGEVPIARLPPQVLPFLYPSRYCESDRLQALALAEFGTMPLGCRRVMAVRDWVQQHITFRSGTSDSSTSAMNTLDNKVGVCRDFAHVMIALCRALNLPARFVTGFDFGADPALGPPDFHAYVEVYLGGRWYLFDPSGTAIPMGMLRLACGRDASEAAFATLFGPVTCHPPVISVRLLTGDTGGRSGPRHAVMALYTDSGEP